ncbi:MAG: threonine dehydratase [Acidimicrobiaceae bacterium]|jgi:threonine dehydratase|nr:threonine dehydratase [Acidimicrobiaceae bacterium]
MNDRRDGLIGLADIEAARDRMAAAKVLRPTPVRRSDSLSALAGRRVVLKPEYLQRTGSFKVRGAYNLISHLPPGSEVVAASAGNHAQGVAFAATGAGMKATIFMPEGASLPKVEATRSYGALVRLEGKVVDDCFALAQLYAADTGAQYVPPFDHPLIMAGQGTVGLELLDEVPEAEVVVVPVGGGGLISGVSAALAQARAARRAGIRVVGVEPAGAACVSASLAAGRAVTLDHIHTMADGIAVKSTSDLVLRHVTHYVDDVVTVDEEEIARAVLLLLERGKAVVEPAGAVGLAAILSGKVGGDGPAVAVLSGGNVDPLLLIKMIDHGLSAAGRYLVFRAVLDDRPGALAGLTATLASMGLNVLQVAHHRSGLELGIHEVDVQMTVETRGPEHRGAVVDALKDAGYRVEPVG